MLQEFRFFYRVLALLMFQCTISILILVKVETLVHKLPHLMLFKILHYANQILVSCSYVLLSLRVIPGLAMNELVVLILLFA